MSRSFERGAYRRPYRPRNDDMRVDERDVPESRHAVFFRGLGAEISKDQVL